MRPPRGVRGVAGMPRKHLAAAGLALACALPATAQARPIIDPPTRDPAPVVVVAPHDGFQWGDAGLSAAGTLLLPSGAGAGAVVVRRRRDDRLLAG
jgi:hypothetical protein